MKKVIIGVSIFLMLNAFSCEKKSETESFPEVSGEPVTITLATFDNMSQTEKNLLTKMSEQNINVEIRFYEGTDTSNPTKMLNLDMISGDCPDVLYVPTQTMRNCIKAGYMSDMSPLLENSPTLSKSDFLPNVIEGLEIDGKIPAVCDGFILSTAVAKTEIVGDAENWTPKQAVDLYSSMPEDTAFLSYSNRLLDVSYYLTERLAIDAVDYQNNNCNFSGEYKKMLDFIEKNPKIMENGYIVPPENAFIKEVTIFGIDNSISLQVFADFQGENVTFIGYPSETGKGYITEACGMFGIPESCPHKSEAFELISLMMSDISANSYLRMGIPALEKRVQDDLKISKYTQSSINCPVNICGEEVQMPEEKIQEVIEYIKNINFNPYELDKEINDIIRQEFWKFLEGEVSPQECTNTLDNRISLYLSETN